MTKDRSASPSESLHRISGTIAHELDGALTVIYGSLHDLSEKLQSWSDAPPQARRALDYAKRGADRVAALASQLQAAAGQKTANAKPLNLSEFLSGLADRLREELPAGIVLKIAADPELWGLQTDAAQLAIALDGLISNAQDAMASGGTLEIKAANAVLDAAKAAVIGLAPGDYIHIVIGDSGIGMPPGIAEHAPEMFFTTKSRAGRLGLGLTQVFAFAASSGGGVSIESQEGKGTRIAIYLPRAAPTTIEAPPVPLPAADGRKSILLVDDDEDLRGYIAETLEDMNYSVATACDSRQAIRHIENEGSRFDLLLTDMQLPGMSGDELARQVLHLQPRMRVLFMSGQSPDEIAGDFKARSLAQLIAKPMTKADLKDRIAKVLSAPA